MYTILAVFSMTRYSPELLQNAVAKARQVDDPEITVLYVTEKKDMEKLKARTGDQGFLGRSSVDRVMHTVLQEHEKLRGERLAEIRRRLGEAGIPHRIYERQGQYSDCVIKEVEGMPYDSVFLPRPSRSFLERLFLGSEVQRVAEYTRREKNSEVNIVE